MAAAGIPTILFVDTMSGILRFLPLTLTVSFIALGIMLNNMPWLLVGAGAVAVWAINTIFHLLGFRIPAGLAPLLGGGVLPAIYDTTCSLIPGITYVQVPSMWFALMGYFMAYILSNASNVYNASAATAKGYTKGSNAGMGSQVMTAGTVVASSNSIGVVQRKSVGLISIIAVSVLFAIIMIPRFMNQCESTFGIISGLAVGAALGYSLWAAINSNKTNPLADIHGVMLGLSPGYLRHSPIACTPPESA